MTTVQIEAGDTEEIIDRRDPRDRYRFSVEQGTVRLSHTKGGASTGVPYEQGFKGIIGDRQGKAVYAYAPSDGGKVKLDLDEAQFSITDVVRTTFTGGAIGMEDPSGAQVEIPNQNQGNLAYGEQTVTTSGTAEALNAGTDQTVPNGAGLNIRAENDNTNQVYVGDSAVDSTTGRPLDPGEAVTLHPDNVADVYVDADADGNAVRWIVEVA